MSAGQHGAIGQRDRRAVGVVERSILEVGRQVEPHDPVAQVGDRLQGELRRFPAGRSDDHVVEPARQQHPSGCGGSRLQQ